jgi:RNA polymerase sigma factor (TIGR02999 family)
MSAWSIAFNARMHAGAVSFSELRDAGYRMVGRHVKPEPDRPAKPETQLTTLLDAARKGDQRALAALLPLVYDELRRLAASHMRREPPGQTIQPTALVHDVYLRLAKDTQLSWQNRAHFFGIAARSMRQILVERSRTRRAAKRGGSRVRVTLDPDLVAAGTNALDLEALDEALTRLAAFDPDLAHLVDVRFFGGLSIEEAAEALDVSPATIKRRWALARAWLARELSPSGPSPNQDSKSAV